MEQTTTNQDKTSQGLVMAKQTKLKFRVGTACIIGKRESQQDSYRYAAMITDANSSDNKDSHSNTDGIFDALVAVVADGVGGAVSGDVASQLAVDSFVDNVKSLTVLDSNEENLKKALDTSNHSIKNAIIENIQFSGMATTIVATIVSSSGLKWVSVGDSHLYLIRNKKFKKLNQDHSLGALVDQQYALGQISKQERDNTLYRNVILSCLSGEKIELIDMHANNFKLRKKDRLILASDGLDTLSNSEILDICVDIKDSQECANTLVDEVNQKSTPHQDNATVLVIDCQ